MKVIDIYPEYVNAAGVADISRVLDFLVHLNANSIEDVVTALQPMLTSRLDRSINYRDVSGARYMGEKYRVLIRLANSFVNKELLPAGCLDNFKDDRYQEFPQWAAVCVKEGDATDLHFCIFYERFSPNWNHEADIIKAVPLKTVIEYGSVITSLNGIKQIDRTAQRLMREHLHTEYKDFISEPDSDGLFKVYISDDRTGRVVCVTGSTVDDVFRTIANDYQGHRNYRRPDACEFAPANDDTKVIFEKWMKTAKGLTSDFDKFYGGGIVD